MYQHTNYLPILGASMIDTSTIKRAATSSAILTGMPLAATDYKTNVLISFTSFSEVVSCALASSDTLVVTRFMAGLVIIIISIPHNGVILLFKHRHHYWYLLQMMFWTT